MAVKVEQAETHAYNETLMTVAGIRLCSNHLHKTDFTPSFKDFWGTSQPFDLNCSLHARGADEALDSAPLQSAKPWSFEVQDDALKIFRRTQSGKTIWRIQGSLNFERSLFDWNPALFFDYYGTYTHCWMRSLGRLMLAWRLRAAGGLLFHGTAAEIDGQGILCAAPSGHGKSTLARLIDAAGGRVLSDESPVIRLVPGATKEAPASFMAYGTPWHSSGGFALNASVPLSRIYFIEHGSDNQIVPLSPAQALAKLINVAIVPWQNPVLFDPALKTIDTLLTTVPSARFAFRPDARAVDALRRSLKNPSQEVQG